MDLRQSDVGLLGAIQKLAVNTQTSRAVLLNGRSERDR